MIDLRLGDSLELSKEGILEISQNKSFGSIKFKYKEGSQKDNINVLRA